MGYLNINPDLFLGSQELNRLVKFLDQEGFRKLFLQNSLSFGLLNNTIGGAFDNFKVSQGTNVGTIKIADGVAVDNQGRILVYAATDNISLTNNNQWYWVTIAHQYDVREVKSVSIDGNGNLFCLGGELTKILRGLPNNPTKVSFPGATINTQEYEVVEVVDDQNAVLAGDFQPESNLRLAVVGAFTPDVPVPTGSKYPFQYDGATITITLESTPNTPPTLTAGVQFTIARVKRNGAAIVIEDKRTSIYQTKADYELGTLALSTNPLIGVEAVKFDSDLTPRDKNLVYLAWTFRSSNWTIDSSANRVTLIAGLGGKFKSTTDFTNGDFDGWRLYTKDGSYAIIRQSTLSATQINLIVDVLDPNKFADTAQQLIVAPNADEIELIFTADPADNNSLADRRVSYHINNGQVIVPLVVYKTPLCLYNFKYRYKSLKVWSQETAIPSDSVGYLIENDFDTEGVQTASVRQAYTSHPTNGFITLNLGSNAYYNRIAAIDTGDLFGVAYRSLTNANPIVNLVVGTNARHQVITNDNNLNASDSDFGSAYTFTVDHYISLSTLAPATLRNGNSFWLQFRGLYTPGSFNLTLTQDYVNAGNTGTHLYRFRAADYVAAALDGIILHCVFDGTRWFVRRIYGGPTPKIQIYRKTSDYTLQLADDGALIEMNLAGANNLTVPPNSSVPFEIGTQIFVAQYGAGQTTLVAGSGVTLRSAVGLKLDTIYSGAALVKIATNEWYVFGRTEV